MISTTNHAKSLNKAIKLCKTDILKVLLFVPLHLNTIHVAVFIDASFGTDEDYSSQLEVFICLTNDNGPTNIVHITSTKSKPIARSVLETELYAFVLGFG